MYRFVLLCTAWTILSGTHLFAQTSRQSNSAYSGWKNGPSADPSYFPIAVWLQNPRNAERYREAGINLYVGLWKGPTEQQLITLKKAGMQVICGQNEVGLNSEHADVIVGWMHGDEPDNAQAKNSGGYGPPVKPAVIQEQYARIRSRDTTRPVLLNLGQGVAYDNYVGRGVRRNHPEDYPHYIEGCDIISFDIYPVVHRNPEVAGKLEFVPRGVRRLRDWADDEQIVWNCIECSRIGNTQLKPTVQQIRAEVWMSLISGSRGIIYFVHQFKPVFKEASILDDPDLLAGIADLNEQLRRLAPVLNSPDVPGAIEVEASSVDSAVQIVCKLHGGSLYAFLANESSDPVSVNLRVEHPESYTHVEFIDDARRMTVRDRQLSIDFEGYGIQLLRFGIDPGRR